MKKKLFTALLAAYSLSIVPVSAETFNYSSQLFLDLSTIDTGWTSYNGTSRAKAWVADPGNCTNKSTAEQFAKVGEGITGGASHQYDNAYQANCWLFSPALELESGVEYTVTIWARTHFTPRYDEHESFKVTVGDDASASSQTTTIINQPSYQNGEDFEKLTGTFTPQTTGEFYFGIHCFSAADQDQLFVTGFSVTGETSGGGGGEDPTPQTVTPAAVSDLSVAADGMDGLEVSLFWEYPSESTTGETLKSGDIKKAEVFRNDEVVYTDDEPGMFGVYADQDIAEPGVYVYKVRVYGADDSYDEENEIEVSAGYVGKPTIELPIDIYYPAPEVAEKFTFNDADDNGATWTYVNASQWSRYFQSTIPDDQTTADDYIGTPYVNLAPGFYEVNFNISGTGQTYELGLATNRHVMNETFAKFDFTGNSGVFEVKETKDYVLVVHHTGTTSADSKTLNLNGLTLKQIIVVPGVATGLSAVGSLDNAVITWTNPSTDNVGNTLAEITKAVIYRDGAELATITPADEPTLAPGQSTSYTDETIQQGAKFKYSVEIYNANGKSNAAAPSVTVFAGKGKEANINKSADFTEWELFHADGTNVDWELSGGVLNFYTNALGGGEAYAATPFIYIEPGYDYTFSLEAYALHADDATLELHCGQAHSVDALAKVGDIALEDGNKKEYSFTISSPREASVIDAGSASPLAVGNNTFAVKATTSKKDMYITSYSITGTESETTAITTIAAGNGAMTYANGIVATNSVAKHIAVFGINGALLAQANNATQLSLAGLAHGQTVVVVADIDGQTHTLKVIL